MVLNVIMWNNFVVIFLSVGEIEYFDIGILYNWCVKIVLLIVLLKKRVVSGMIINYKGGFDFLFGCFKVNGF